MDASNVFKKVVTDSGMRMADISRAIGYNENYVNSKVKRSNVPRVDTLALVSDVCGFDLLVRHRKTGDETIIDPPKREQS